MRYSIALVLFIIINCSVQAQDFYGGDHPNWNRHLHEIQPSTPYYGGFGSGWFKGRYPYYSNAVVPYRPSYSRSYGPSYSYRSNSYHRRGSTYGRLRVLRGW